LEILLTLSASDFSRGLPNFVANGNSQLQKHSEDLGFLRHFGDATDEFYELDVELLRVLDGGFEVDRTR